MKRKEMTFKEMKTAALLMLSSWRAPSMREIARGQAIWLADEKTYVVITDSQTNKRGGGK